ncbi:hypothetical protein DMN91_009460 [Ooceraea biroi]|uniref:Uncharacterized protein n=1 Tax=Ooceraea biroi TaxID=2015173 RepID=A0A026WIR1_OOCBI|nr:uncharacterized protein LOC105279471 [Ooceraea biroi]EZA54989.1 hypothetical protein X777_04452 [Ooceraea biroi]RLU19102.1 hypothetical protein DMN91_009460 [Ooceraea biroi]
MRCLALCVLLLAISEPLLIHAKVVLVVPRQIRRSPATPWRPPPHKKSPYGSNDFHHPPYYGSALSTRYYTSKKPFRPLPYPHGGDDFDQGHESVNHVHIPYSKDVSHGISFGKGYIPYDNLKSSSLPFVQDRYAGTYARQPVGPDFTPTGFTSVGQEYAASATATQSYEGPHVDSFFSDMESATRSDSLKDTAGKYYAARSIEKDLTLRNQQALGASGAEREDPPSAKGTEVFLPKDAPPAAYGHVTGTSGAVILPAGIPPATIAGNKEGIVLRDTVSLDEYQRKLEELTKTWPSVLSAGTNGAASFVASAPIHQPLQAVGRFPTGGLVGTGFAGGPTGGADWLAGLQAQSKQGYAVREDQGDPTTHDFRTMPIHTAASSYPQLPQFAGANTVVPARAFAPNFHG